MTAFVSFGSEQGGWQEGLALTPGCDGNGGAVRKDCGQSQVEGRSLQQKEGHLPGLR